MNKIKNFWEDFCNKNRLPLDTPYDAWSFGMDSKTANELADLVDKGIKTATTSAYGLDDEELSKVGEYNIILDGNENPICVTQTKVVYIMPYNLITPEHAWHEGEGDRSYNYWRKVHDKFFEEEFKLYGKKFYEQAPMVCEVFEKIG